MEVEVKLNLSIILLIIVANHGNYVIRTTTCEYVSTHTSNIWLKMDEYVPILKVQFPLAAAGDEG